MAQAGPVAWLCRLGRGRSGVTAPSLDSPLILLLSAPLWRLPINSGVQGAPIFTFGFPTSWLVDTLISAVSTLLIQYLLVSLFSFSRNFMATFHLLLSLFIWAGGWGRGKGYIKKIILRYYFDSVLMTWQRWTDLVAAMLIYKCHYLLFYLWAIG